MAMFVTFQHRRRIKTEEKAKRSSLLFGGTNLLNSLLRQLKAQDDFEEQDEFIFFFQIILVQFILLFSSRDDLCFFFCLLPSSLHFSQLDNHSDITTFDNIYCTVYNIVDENLCYFSAFLALRQTVCDQLCWSSSTSFVLPPFIFIAEKVFSFFSQLIEYFQKKIG